jgi:hypothetical protein
VLILNDFKSLFPEVLILEDFKSFAPEVLILEGLKSIGISELQRIWRILEVLILRHFKSCRMSSSENWAEFLGLAIRLKLRWEAVCGATRDRADGA